MSEPFSRENAAPISRMAQPRPLGPSGSDGDVPRADALRPCGAGQ
jgi:hypothetical protein